MIFPRRIIEIEINNQWLDITSQVFGDITIATGFNSVSHDNRLAATGRLSFKINNYNDAYYTLTNGLRFRIRLIFGGMNKTIFSGWISNIKPSAGEYEQKVIHVVALDWFDFATKHYIRARAAQENKTMDYAVGVLLTGLPILPNNTDFDTGAETFKTILDSAREKYTVYSQLNDLVMSEMGYVYLTDGGETLKVESNVSRNGLRELRSEQTNLYFVLDDGSLLLKEDGDYLLNEDGGRILLDLQTSPAVQINTDWTFDRTFTELDIQRGVDVINEVSFNVYPRRVGTSVENLFVHDISKGSQAIRIEPGRSYTLLGGYANPNGGGSVSGVDIVTPVASTDYLFNDLPNGTGTNLTGSLSISFTAGANGFISIITNTTDDNIGYLTRHNVRGKPVFRDNPIEYKVDDVTSQDLYGIAGISIRQPYQQTTKLAILESEKILDDEREPRTKLLRASIIPRNNTQLVQYMKLEIGDLVKIISVKPSLNKYYYIMAITTTLVVGGLIKYNLLLKESYSLHNGLSPVAVEFRGENSKNMIEFPETDRLNNMQQITATGWVYVRRLDLRQALINKRGFTFNNTGWNFYVSDPPTGYTGKLFFAHYRTSWPGSWATTNQVMVINQWMHVAVTYDASSVSNDPVFYVDGSSVAVTEVGTPVGTPRDDSGVKLTIGNYPYFGQTHRMDGFVKDVRIYNRVLSASEIQELANNENDYFRVTDNLVFQGMMVKTDRVTDYIDNIITTDMRLIDNYSGMRGTVFYAPGYEMYGRDPEETSY